MRIECPACATAYQVPDGHVAAGQQVRCARCGSDWMPIEPLPELGPEPEPIAPPLAEAEAAPPEPEPPLAPMVPERVPMIEPEVIPPSRLPLRLAWAFSLLLIGGAIVTAYAQRAAIMHAWPPSTRAYTALGLTAQH